MKTLVSYKNPLPYKHQGTRTLNREDPRHRTLWRLRTLWGLRKKDFFESTQALGPYLWGGPWIQDAMRGLLKTQDRGPYSEPGSYRENRRPCEDQRIILASICWLWTCFRILKFEFHYADFLHVEFQHVDSEDVSKFELMSVKQAFFRATRLPLKIEI